MAEEHEHHTHMARGQHHEEGHKDKDRALYWGLGLGAAGLVVALLLFMGGGNKKQGQPTTVNASQPFYPNPTDVSIGQNIGALYWPGFPTQKKKGHEDESKNHKKKHGNKSNDQKGFGRSPHGASHGHVVSGHNVHNPKTVATKGHQNG